MDGWMYGWMGKETKGVGKEGWRRTGGSVVGLFISCKIPEAVTTSNKS